MMKADPLKMMPKTVGDSETLENDTGCFDDESETLEDDAEN